MSTTIKLNGHIDVKRIFGTVNVVPSDGNSGGPLQAKTVYPSHSEQIIAPDEDYYGLVSVTVKPVPKLPACEVSVAGDGDNVVENVVNVGAEVSVEGNEFIQTHALYGSLRLPIIPEDVLTQYPYAFIYKKDDENFYRLMFSTDIWWYSYSSGDGYLYPVVTESRPVYKATTTSEEWEYLEEHTASSIYTRYYNIYYVDCYWTNFDIPSGSATATSYFKTATEPGLTI